MTIHPSPEMTRSDLVEFNTHSFVIKIWLEVTPKETGRTSWRGHITHIPSGERRYVSSLFGILTFIIRYLKTMGLSFDRFWWVKDWIASQKFPRNEVEGEVSSIPPSAQVKETKLH
ncbi:MAG: hypothetical protein A2Z14_06370 [Chloroflexi bacterium RBG_16_48_8]|nr:MAG: hypothetical protein A2Z14_06370 [Chloroflexi bacterium RBG_16_48_8]